MNVVADGAPETAPEEVASALNDLEDSVMDITPVDALHAARDVSAEKESASLGFPIQESTASNIAPDAAKDAGAEDGPNDLGFPPLEFEFHPDTK